VGRKIVILALLLVGAIAAIASVRSVWRWDVVTVRVTQRIGVRYIGVRGSMAFAVGTIRPYGPGNFEWVWREPQGDGLKAMHYGFLAHCDGENVAAGMPGWLLCALCLAAAWRVSRRYPPDPGKCEACGYDLRATPESGGELLAVCPECGRAGTAMSSASHEPT
jgi:hypothetical protein